MYIVPAFCTLCEQSKNFSFIEIIPSKVCYICFAFESLKLYKVEEEDGMKRTLGQQIWEILIPSSFPKIEIFFPISLVF